MATDNLQLNYLTINQAQKEEVFNDNMNTLDQEFTDLGSRVTSLEQGGGGTGGTSYDDTELRNRITQNELDIDALQQTDISLTSDINSLQTLTGQHSTQIGSLQTSNTNILNRLDDVEDSDILQDSEINDLEDRVIVLENAGGSGYNDTELRNRITTNEDDIVSLNTFYTDLSDRVDTIESVNSTQNNTLDGYGIRITDLENASQFDPTSIENRLTDVEQDLSIVKTNQTNIQNNFNSLENNVNTFDNRIQTNESDIDALQLSDSQQDDDISNLDTRVTDLENSGGGTSYDDTELRNRITQNESDIDALQLSDNTQSQEIDALELTSQDHETRITTLENSGGNGGGGEMPQTGEVRKFLESNIPANWYKISEYPYPKDAGIDWLVANNNVINGTFYSNSNLKTTSSFNTFSLFSNNLYIFNRNIKDFDLIQSNIGFSGDSRNNIFNKDGSNIAYIYNINTDESITLLDYNLSDNTYTSFTSNAPVTTENLYDQNATSLIDKNHENIYTIIRTNNNTSIYIFKTNILNKTFEYELIDSSIVFNGGGENYSNIRMIYFNSHGNIVVQYTSKSIEINKDDITIHNDYTNNSNALYSTINLNSPRTGSTTSDLVWSGDNQFILARNSNEIVMIDNYSSIIYRDLFNINLNNFSSNAISTIFFDIDSNVYLRSTSDTNSNYPLLLAKNRLFNTSNVTSNNFVDCVYNVPQ